MSEKDENESLSEEMQELHTKALEYFDEATTGWRTVREQALNDIQFYRGNQWDAQLTRVAKVKNEPTLTVNRLPQFTKQIENELRQREMSIQAHATDESSSEETANIFSSLIRSIEQDSHAKSHYIHAAGENGALVPGVGYIKAEVDYVHPGSFDQKIIINSVKDPMKVLADPAAMEPDFSDAEYWFEFDDYPEKVFKKLWPKSTIASGEFFPTGASMSKWITDSGIRVARFWYKEEEVVVHYLLDNGDIVVSTELQGPEYEDMDTDNLENDDELPDGRVVLRRKETKTCKIKWADMTGAEILDQGDWAGDYFPFSAVTGPITIVDGVRDIRGIIRYAKDSQKMLNYMASSAARRIASANKSPWIVEASSIKNYKRMWDTTNTENWPYLPYDQFDANGNMRQINAPTRADQTGQIQDLLAASQKFENDLKATIGIYDAGLGATPNEQSGVAIKTLAQQGQNANFHFSDNLVRSLQHFGRILINLIPKIYDTPRVVRIVNAEGQPELIKINQIFEKNGQEKAYYLNEGDYGVTVNVGPAYATAKQAAIEQMLELARINPNLLPYIQDIIAGNMDYQGKDIVKNRLTKLLAMTAPAMIEGTPEADISPLALGKIQQQTQMIDALTKELQSLQAEFTKLTNILATKQIEHKNEMEKLEKQTQDAMAIQEQKARDEYTIEQERAKREAINSAAQLEMQAVKTQLAHTEKMMQVVIAAMKQFGPEAGTIIQGVVPQATATVDQAMDASEQNNQPNLPSQGI